MVTAKKPPTYEAALQELEELIRRLEGGQLPLDEMLAGYQRGSELLQFCQGKLESVQNQIRVMQAQDGAPKS